MIEFDFANQSIDDSRNARVNLDMQSLNSIFTDLPHLFLQQFLGLNDKLAI
jgi:hypothetical protein